MRSNYCICSADRTQSFKAHHEAEASLQQPQFLMYYCLKLEDDSALFSDLLKKEDVGQIKKYAYHHHLSASEEYQMIVTLTFAMENEAETEKIICGYIRRYGLSLKAKQALKDFGFEKALKVLEKLEPDDVTDLCNEKISVMQKLTDGFRLMRN